MTGTPTTEQARARTTAGEAPALTGERPGARTPAKDRPSSAEPTTGQPGAPTTAKDTP